MEVLVEPGEFRQVVTIQQLVETPQADGSTLQTWTTVGNWRAQVKPLSGRELMEAKALQANTTHKVFMPYYSGLTPNHRLVVSFGGTLNIESVLDIDSRNRIMELRCQEVVT